ncbi:AraC family transcriptional regulator [Paenibacillus xylanilyticus]|uniref:Helix-turn-helix transcriptional regulator n=1 Tax=Paenibacillus xylanilyticus TaxID=248903 RepID=A0A7Y6EUR8_9BACL|nr:AraC family transcriptional regulator [Paenibacillus xylanilyticus]NUU74994.1 helix-turn-helix transcriptional regulator [Paenibacillus xylanilyticus]
MGNLYYENHAGTFLVSHRKALSHHMPVSHFHSTYEIYILMSGKREFFIQDRTITINEGDVVIIAPNILHRTTNAERPKHERLIINMHEQYFSLDGSHREALLPMLDRDYLILKDSLRNRQLIEPQSRAIIQEMQERSSGFELFAQTLAVQLLIMCCRQFKQHDAEPLASPSPMHERISEIVRYINEHYMEELSLHLLADRFFISPYYLSRSFKEATGFAFVEYVNSVRIKEAKKQLESSSLKVNLIARKVGFGSVTHFGRVFKVVTGHSPLHYRRKGE